MSATVLVILHGLVAVFLLGATSHQAIGAWKAKPMPGNGFVRRAVNVHGAVYTNAIVILYFASVVGGGLVYPAYILTVKGSLNDANMLAAIGSFEIKEHFAIFGLAMLPSYWYVWKQADKTRFLMAQRITSTIIALLVWWCFVVGAVLNNIKGLI